MTKPMYPAVEVFSQQSTQPSRHLESKRGTLHPLAPAFALALLLPALLISQTAAPAPKMPASTQKPGIASPAFDALAKKAEAARQANNAGEAIRLYQEAVRIKTGWSEGWWYLGTLYYDSDRYAEGQEAFGHLTGLEPTMAVAWAMQGLCEFETKSYERALAHLEKADQLHIPEELGFYDVSQYHLALLLTRSGRFEEAMAIIARYARKAKDSPNFVEAMGIATLRKPLLPSELPPLERELVMDVGRAMCDAAARRTADASTEMAEIVKKYPATPQVHFLYGMVMLTNDPDKAVAALKDELTTSPNHAEALISLAGEYLRRTEFTTALPYAEKAVLSKPGYFATYAMLGRVLVEGDIDIPRGTKELEKAVKMAPGNPQVRFALATAYTKAGRKEEAAKERAEFLRLRSQDNATVAEQK
jgi:tetratricopeptide (TPR) repeat protein